MNIALTTLVFLLLLVPGFLFRRLYYSGEFSKEYFKENFFSLIFPTLISSGLIHLLAYTVFTPWLFVPDSHVLATLLSGTDDSDALGMAVQNALSNYHLVLFYFLIASTIGGIFGWLLKWFVRKYKLDRKFKILRFQNEWHYIFSGEILDFPNIPGDAENIDLVFVDALVASAEGTLIYRGLLSDYVLAGNNGIDHIYLKEVKRRYLKDDESMDDDKRYYDMPGDFFVIPFKNIMNLHISYYSINTQRASDTPSGQASVS